MVRAALFASTNTADILIVPPHIVAADCAVVTLNEDPAAPNSVAPAITSLVVRTKSEMVSMSGQGHWLWLLSCTR